jgi:hypothetical protein
LPAEYNNCINEEFPKPRLRAFAGFPLIAEAIRS